MSEPTHPPVMPVDKLFFCESGFWFFRIEMRLIDLSQYVPPDFRRIISALQRCAWEDEAERIMRADISENGDGEYDAPPLKYMDAQHNAAAWKKWGEA